MAWESLARKEAGAIGATRAWHNPLPRLIREDSGFVHLKAQYKQTLQAIADACYPPSGEDDSLVGAVGGRELMIACVGINRRGQPRRSTFWAHIRKLEILGFVVLLMRGGVVGSRSVSNIYGIPCRPGGLDHRRTDREFVQMVAEQNGRLRRRVLERGQQANLWADVTNVTNHRPVQKVDGGSPETGRVSVQKVDGGSPESGHHTSCMSVWKKHKSNSRADIAPGKTTKGFERRKKLPHIEIQDLRDTRRLLHLFGRAVSKGIIEGSEYRLLQFVAIAERALQEGHDPCALFADMVNRQQWLFVTEGYEQAARKRLRETEGNDR